MKGVEQDVPFLARGELLGWLGNQGIRRKQ